MVRAAETSDSVWATVDALDLEASLLSAARWVRRRILPVRAALSALVGLLPLLAGVQPTVAAIGATLETGEVLVRLRQLGADHLAALPPPVGFGPRRRPPSRLPHRLQHSLGPDPPS